MQVQGEVLDVAVNKALSELAVMGGYPGDIVFGGPWNSLVEHGTGESKGFWT